jgi:hypothetical protein
MTFQGAMASAAVFDWSYSGFNGVAVSAAGTLDATPLGGGVYQVDSISGERNGVVITGLTDYAGNDNYVYTASPNVDYPGLAYTTTDGSAYNVYYDTSTADSYACGLIGYCEIGPGAPGTSGLGPPVDSIGPMSAFTLTAVPELSTWAMMLVGFAGVGYVGLLRSKRYRSAVSSA